MKSKEQLLKEEKNVIEYLKEIYETIKENPELSFSQEMRESIRSQSSILFFINWTLSDEDVSFDEYSEKNEELIQKKISD